MSEASGTAERDGAEAMIKVVPGRHPITVGGDKVDPVLRPRGGTERTRRTSWLACGQ